MTADEPTLPPERVEELRRALGDADPLALDNTRYEWALRSIAESLAPLIAGWLAEAYSRGVNDTFDTDGALMKAWEEGAADVRARVERVLADEWRDEPPSPLYPEGRRQCRWPVDVREQLRAALAEPEDRR